MATVQGIKDIIETEVSFSGKVNSYYIFQSVANSYGSGGPWDEVSTFIEEIREATSELVGEGKITLEGKGNQTFYVWAG